jgi:hypothetical protein
MVSGPSALRMTQGGDKPLLKVVVFSEGVLN